MKGATGEAGAGGRSARLGPPLPRATMFGFGIAVAAVILIAFLSYQTLESRAGAADAVSRSLDIIGRLSSLQSSLTDAETAQRGFLLTLEPAYLGPYTEAKSDIPGQLSELRTLLDGQDEQTKRIDIIEGLSTEKLDEMAQTIAAAREGNATDALAIVRSGHGRELMDRIRTLVADAERAERLALVGQQKEWSDAVTTSTLVSAGGSFLLLVLLAGAAVVASRDFQARRTQIWLRTGQIRLATRLQGEQRLDQLGEGVLAFLADYLDAQAGAIYLAQRGGTFRRFAGFALPPDRDGAGEVRPGEGLLGQAAKEMRTIHVRDVPANYFPVESSLGRADARELLLAPATSDGRLEAMVELGFFHEVDPSDRELLDLVAGMLGAAVRASRDRTRLEELLEETQRQGEELQAQQEELRSSNEELEEQGRVLRESQVRLEAQQVELEQTNTQLEEQMQQLEAQRNDLARSQDGLVEKSQQLERASQYKSEFLANMSHELRTPLNSSLILAKVLADNKDGNLSPDQVRYAQAITSAGKDLLALINDILDLSKIEAGQVGVYSEPIDIVPMIEALVASVEPLAQNKKLSLAIEFTPGVPKQIETDPQRLGQILRNLLSNALKFTEAGEVRLSAATGPNDTIVFEVRDSGIGIPADQQDVIFEAFRQVDGSAHRKYSGTGLGLSISRDLARLLGGDITVSSAPGEGSVFTVRIPLVFQLPAPVETAHEPVPPSVSVPAAALTAEPRKEVPVLRPAQIDDDRENIKAGQRLILVVEDDTRFATILRDLAREMGYQCVATHAANDGVAAATIFRPDAILLDMNLPDHSGLGVLDQLKHNPRTRHIPVHVVSVSDYSQAAMEMGAIGYELKPVQREQLVGAIRQLGAKLSQRMKRVLVVEGDEIQRQDIARLLGNGDVQVVGAKSAADALKQLGATTFDCMVMDLDLPDLSGYEMLSMMAGQEDVSFPPVIVYTARAISTEEEHTLRRHSRSIIIKDARSPERLLDEVTLFLHKVESELPAESQRMLASARHRDEFLERRRILVVEDDVRNIFALSSLLEPRGAIVEIARNGREALDAVIRAESHPDQAIDLVLMDIMMPEMDGLTATREIRKRVDGRKLPIIALTAKAMKDDQDKCLEAGANDYIAKPLDVDKLLSLLRVWTPK